jgi:hypothetical protein
MPISGSWLAQKRTPDPQQAALHEIDPSHDEPGSVDYVPTWQAQPYQEVAPGPETIGFEWVTRAPGIATQVAPWEDGHDYQPGHTTSDAPQEGRSPGVRAQHSGESYQTDAFDGLGRFGNVSEISDQARRIGKNADPVSNPGDASYGGLGYRPGHYRQWNLWRKMAPPFRIHDARVAALNIVTAIGDSPTPIPASPYNSPFSSLARIRRTVNVRPGLRRIPEQFDEAVITDGSEQPAYPHRQISGEWVAR